MPATATLSSKFRISIPKAVREEQHWEAGQEFVFIPKGKGVLVMPVPSARNWPASPRARARTATAPQGPLLMVGSCASSTPRPGSNGSPRSRARQEGSRKQFPDKP